MRPSRHQLAADNSYLKRSNKVVSASCPSCGAGFKTVRHFLLVCPGYALSLFPPEHHHSLRHHPPPLPLLHITTLPVTPKRAQDRGARIATLIERTTNGRQPMMCPSADKATRFYRAAGHNALHLHLSPAMYHPMLDASPILALNNALSWYSMPGEP